MPSWRAQGQLSSPFPTSKNICLGVWTIGVELYCFCITFIKSEELLGGFVSFVHSEIYVNKLSCAIRSLVWIIGDVTCIVYTFTS